MTFHGEDLWEVVIPLLVAEIPFYGVVVALHVGRVNDDCMSLPCGVEGVNSLLVCKKYISISNITVKLFFFSVSVRFSCK